MTTTFNSIVARALICCVAALATALWARAASAFTLEGTGLIHAAGAQGLCFNNPYQSSNNGNQLVISPHCDFSDPGSLVTIVDLTNGGGHGDLKLGFRTKDWNRLEMCMDNLNGAQQEHNPIVAWECNGGDTQKWRLVQGVFHYAANPSMCASEDISGDPNDPPGSGKLVLAHCNSQGNQQFVLDLHPDRSITRGDVPRRGGGAGAGGGGCEKAEEGEEPHCPR